MPLTTNFDVTKTAKTQGNLWVGVSIPAANARLALDANGHPDATANPNAKHIGYTKEGCVFTLKRELENDFADETRSPIRTSIKETGASISGEILQVMDFDVLEKLTVGVGTKATGTGYEELSLGESSLSYSGVALIFPTEADPTKFAVFHLYKAINTEGLETPIGRTKQSSIKFNFTAFAVDSRAKTDNLGKAWKQVA